MNNNPPKPSRNRSHLTFHLIGLIMSTFVIMGCVARIPAPTESTQHLWPCPPLLNCVASEGFFIYDTKPFKLTPLSATLSETLNQATWNAITNSVEGLPRTKITFSNDFYIRARSHTKFFHFVDYLEVLHRKQDNILEVRSVSLLGIFDFGVNRLRVEKLRKFLLEKELISPTTD